MLRFGHPDRPYLRRHSDLRHPSITDEQTNEDRPMLPDESRRIVSGLEHWEMKKSG